MLSIFPGKNGFMEKSAGSLCNSIFNAVIDAIDERKRDARVQWYTSTNQLLTL